MSTTNKVVIIATIIAAIITATGAIVAAVIQKWPFTSKEDLTITVQDAGTNEPIPGTIVKVDGKLIKPDESQKYELRLKSGQHIVTASAGKKYEEKEETIVVVPDQINKVDLELELKKGSIEGIVTDNTNPGTAISDAIVIVEAEGTSTGTSASDVTDESGKYEFALKPGEYTVSASAKMYAQAEETGIVVSPAETTSKSFKLIPKKGSITGTVEAGGNAISGAIVKAEDASTGIKMTDVTDPSGTFHFNELNLIPGKYIVSTSAYKYGAKTQEVSVEPDKSTTMGFELEMNTLFPDKWVTAPPFSGFKVEASWKGDRPDYQSAAKTWTLPPDQHGWVIIEPLEINVASNNNGGYNSPIISGRPTILTEPFIRDVYGSAINVATRNGQNKIAEQLKTEMNTRIIDEIRPYSTKGNTIQVPIWARAFGSFPFNKKRGWITLSSVRVLLRYIGKPDKASLVADLAERYNIDMP